MTAPWEPPSRGALDDSAWPEKLVAKAVAPGTTDDRLHGYAVLGDLAGNYRYSDVVYLALVGELPDERASALFQLALCSFAPAAVNEAPTHVSLLSRICGGSLASALGAGVIVLADQARYTIDAHAALLPWLAMPSEATPPQFCDPAHVAWVRTLRQCVSSTRFEAALVKEDMSRDAARIALLFEAGVRTAEQMQAAIISSRFCGLASEALAAGPADLKLYPVLLPPFHYVEDGVVS